MMSWKLQIFTAFPEFFPGPLAHSLIGRAHELGFWHDDIINLRHHTNDKHQSIDAPPYGGGAGMVMRVDVVDKALHAALDNDLDLILPSPRGKPINQDWCKEKAKGKGLAIICSRYQGIDERIIKLWKPELISMGDYILAGGETAAIIMAESCIRLLQQVIGNPESHTHESHDDGLLEHPHYTKPSIFNGHDVPAVLRGGNHKHILQWQHEQRQNATQCTRPDLWQKWLSKQQNKTQSIEKKIKPHEKASHRNVNELNS